MEKLVFKHLAQSVNGNMRTESELAGITLVVAACQSGWCHVQKIKILPSNPTDLFTSAHESGCGGDHSFAVETFPLDDKSKEKIGYYMTFVNDRMIQAVMQLVSHRK